ncbi:hypothetical protein B0T26DRAFT_642211 [Lasiosphaeria miniovina]|uniref:Uncharacterized protein n=1 Tax=Lasiosphaeria miniovina TaxID=1954250 RepID=A0AA40AVW9_9PEZI|nr:uncharacterized protein B0T26DRAFT_642211 [Lasiosphaeria miniovina]KAK0722936.1 hypothetical protein B0T26DRAFT_642211 [Lasiosphaeria miniovina]
MAPAAEAVDGPAAASPPSLAAVAARPRGGGALEPRHRPARRAKLPEALRFALVVVLSFSIAALGQAFLHQMTAGEVDSIARQPAPTTTEIAVLAGWRLLALALGWLGDFDAVDLAALALLSHGPAAHLTSAFYGIRALTAAAYLGLDVVSTFLPFLLLRQISGAHSAAPGVPNREIVVDRGIQVLTGLLSGLTYTVILFLASRAYLPTALVLYFDDIPTIIPAAEAGMFFVGSPLTQAATMLFGVAARSFIFTPTVTTPPTAQDQENAEFDPVRATLGETVAWNLWGFTSRTKVSISRTAVAMLFTGVGTYLQCALTINGVESYGAVVYASAWVMATLVTGLAMKYVATV